MSLKPAAGYRRKPKRIILLALAFIFAPLGNLVWSLWQARIPNWWQPEVLWFWASQVPQPSKMLMFTIFLAGVTLLLVRRWTLYFALAALAATVWHNVFMFNELAGMTPITLALMIGVTALVGLTLWSNHFRKPYLDPLIRWWETSPRYRVRISVKVREASEPATLLDISRTGMLVEWSDPKQIPQLGAHTDITLLGDLNLPCHVARRTEHGYGLQFEPLSPQQKVQLKNWLNELAKDPTRLAHPYT